MTLEPVNRIKYGTETKFGHSVFLFEAKTKRRENGKKCASVADRNAPLEPVIPERLLHQNTMPRNGNWAIEQRETPKKTTRQQCNAVAEIAEIAGIAIATPAEQQVCR